MEVKKEPQVDLVQQGTRGLHPEGLRGQQMEQALNGRNIASAKFL
jgi:hypothetical protein